MAHDVHRPEAMRTHQEAGIRLKGVQEIGPTAPAPHGHGGCVGARQVLALCVIWLALTTASGPLWAQQSTAGLSSIPALLANGLMWDHPAADWIATLEAQGWRVTDVSSTGMPVLTGKFFGDSTTLTLSETKRVATGRSRPQASSDVARTVGAFWLKIHRDTAWVGDWFPSLADSVAARTGLATQWALGRATRALAIQRRSWFTTWGNSRQPSEGWMFTAVMPTYTALYANGPSELAHMEAMRVAAEPATAEVEADAVSSWKTYEAWEVDVPASLLRCRRKAPALDLEGEVKIKVRVWSHGGTDVSDISEDYHSVTWRDQEKLREWVRDECTFLAGTKGDQNVTSMFTLTVRYR